MKLQTLPRWNNFTVPQLKEILQHCTALDQLGIAQDEEMMASIERDIELRQAQAEEHRIVSKALKPAKQPKGRMLEQTA